MASAEEDVAEARYKEGEHTEKDRESSPSAVVEVEPNKKGGGQHLETLPPSDGDEPAKSKEDVRKARMDRLRELHLRRVSTPD